MANRKCQTIIMRRLNRSRVFQCQVTDLKVVQFESPVVLSSVVGPIAPIGYMP